MERRMKMEYKPPPSPSPSCLEPQDSHDFDRRPAGPYKPRIILHGGAGSMSRDTLPHESWMKYKTSMLRILKSTDEFLKGTGSESKDGSFGDAALHGTRGERVDTHTMHNDYKGADAHSSPIVPTALDAAVHAVQLLESDPLFNAGIGAVFTRAGTIELEASVMVSRGSRKRAAAVSLIKHVRSPICLAAEMLKRGEADDGDGAQKHVHLSGEQAEDLARKWGCETCEEKVFWTRKRWEEHMRGLEKEKSWSESGFQASERAIAAKPRLDEAEAETEIGDSGLIVWPDEDPSWDGREYLPQGTVGCVVLDSFGTLAVATSTGGMTNKLPGRIGDTPTVGAGFWAEEWMEKIKWPSLSLQQRITNNISGLLPFDVLSSCIPSWTTSHAYVHPESDDDTSVDPTYEGPWPPRRPPRYKRHAVAMSGTGNGDSFLRLCAVRSTAALVRFTSASSYLFNLDQAIQWMAGPHGELQRSAGVHWGKTGEGEGGIIGIDFNGGVGYIVADFNRAMFRAWIDDRGVERCMVFRDEY